MSGALALRPQLPRRDPRAWCGASFPWPLVRELPVDRDVVACYLVLDKQRKETRAAKPYLQLVLGDRTGTIPAMVWDDAERLDRLFAAEDVVGVRGRVGTYQDKPQLTVTVLEPLEVDEEDLAFFVPTTPRDRAEMARELEALVRSIADPPLRMLVERCTSARTALGRSYRVHPAAKRNHHAYIGGLLEHSLSVATAADRLAAHYQAQGAPIDRDLLVAGALLHDIGKVRELTAGRSFGYTAEGHLLGHIVIGIQVVEREAEGIPGLAPDRLLHLQHLVASHQGRLEWASPKVPMTLEAMLLHYADDLDSKMNPAMALLGDVREGEWSRHDRHLDRSLWRPPAFPESGAVEPVPASEVVEVVLDMFRG